MRLDNWAGILKARPKSLSFIPGVVRSHGGFWAGEWPALISLGQGPSDYRVKTRPQGSKTAKRQEWEKWSWCLNDKRLRDARWIGCCNLSASVDGGGKCWRQERREVEEINVRCKHWKYLINRGRGGSASLMGAPENKGREVMEPLLRTPSNPEFLPPGLSTGCSPLLGRRGDCGVRICTKMVLVLGSLSS